MRLLCSIIILLLLFLYPFQLYSQGLKIKGNNAVIEKRTSYTVFDKIRPIFTDKLELHFDIAFQDFTGDFAIGYILRIKNEEENTTYNILYNAQGDDVVFNFNHEGKDVLIVAKMNKKDLSVNPWIKIDLLFDLQQDIIQFKINGVCFDAKNVGLKPKWKPAIYYGKSEHVIDIPTYLLRNLTVNDYDQSFYFPLNESNGEEVHDGNRTVIGEVLNPEWLINDASYWRFKTSFTSRSIAGSIFNSATQEVYFTNKDSIILYNIRSGETYTQKYLNACPLKFNLGTNFIDTEKNRLYFYEVSTELIEGVTMAYLDLRNFSWTAVSTETLPTQLHHHASFFDSNNRRYIVFGGFGNTYYNKEFFSYDLEQNKWSTLTFTGDKITPRYFSSIGYKEDENALYLFGGMGNESGNHSVGRVYYYDLYKIDLKNNMITKLWEIKQPSKENVVPVRSLILSDDDSFYTLCYPEHFSKSSLVLYRFSLKDGSHQILADSIPIISEKITTHGNVYYNSQSEQLCCIVQEFEQDDIASLASIYTINFPPVTTEALMFYSDFASGYWTKRFMFGAAILLLMLIGYLLANRKKEKRSEDVLPVVEEKDKFEESVLLIEKPLLPTRINAIYLFGEFSVIDKQHKEINYLFSTKLKQAFFLILQYSLDKGITSQEFSDLMWPNKAEDKLKNSRGVILNNLRKILNDIDGVKLVYEKGYFKIVFTEECYCDYIRCLEIISGQTANLHAEELIGIFSRGKFLDSIDIPLLESFKKLIDSNIKSILLIELDHSFDANLYKRTLLWSESIFHIDRLNEKALQYQIRALMKLKRANDAKKRYRFFILEYKKVMGKEYGVSFVEIVK